MGHPQQALEKGARCRPTSGWSPRAGPGSAERWWLTALSHISQSISVIITRDWRSQALSFCSGHFSKSRRVFGWSQLNFLGSNRRVQWKQQKCSLLSQTHSRCGRTPKLFAFVTMIFAIFQTMSMVSLNKIGTRVLEHEPKAWVAFFIGHPVVGQIQWVFSFWWGYLGAPMNFGPLLEEILATPLRHPVCAFAIWCGMTHYNHNCVPGLTNSR